MRYHYIKIILFISMTVLLPAKVSVLNYEATFGIFGKVGTIDNTLRQNDNSYTIETRVSLLGIAKMLLKGQEEHYVSKGHMENGLMVSDFYEMTTLKGNKKKVKTYSFDHQKKLVTKRYRKWKDGKVVKDKTETLKFYAKDDLLTLYFNLNTALYKKNKKYLFKVVGLEKQNGKVYITVPSDKKVKWYKQNLGEGAKLYAKALIHQRNFKKKKGDILLAIGQDGFIQKSVIKDILLYGDAVLNRVK
ncbi:MAG: Unknown protein [uncultured Sulfurovum sp.]|uniref:DUF3108 domain-containing protein n=1 Tax=uncultured Sulfurovum sp. TaxID=269237 RepID=A0A6S6TY23_9BACT|nr:MAG: Unknown protein [uncultured Sulfurovum sp.]